MLRQKRIDSLVAAGQYDAAARMLAKALSESPGSVPIRQRLSDVLALAGRRDEAAGLLIGLAEEFAADGFTAKAIATIKKVQRVDRRRPEMAARLAELILVRNQEIGMAPSGKGEQARAELLHSLPSLELSPLIGALTAEELVTLIRGLELESYGPDETVFAEGELADSLYVVAGGSGRILARRESGEVEEVDRLRYGDFFGGTALLGSTPSTVTVRAGKALDALRLSRERFGALVSSHPRIADTLRRFVEQRAR